MELYEDIKALIITQEKYLSDRALAFYQGALWALASTNKDLEQDYIALCKKVERMQ